MLCSSSSVDLVRETEKGKKDPMWGCTGNASKWRKASHCKTLIKKLQSNVKVQRRRRECMVRQSRADIAELLRGGRLPEALHRAEQIVVEERRISAYDQIESFCAYMLQNYSHFQHQSGDVHLLPDEMKEATAGLIFSASRIGEILELQSIRNLFRQRFGSEFDVDSVELRPGNVVGSEIKQSLEAKTTMPSDATPELLMGIVQNDQANTPSEAPPSTLGDDDSADQEVKKTDKMKKLKMMVQRMTEKTKIKKESSLHVHPNLPGYEDFEAKLQGLRTEQRRSDLSEFLR